MALVQRWLPLPRLAAVVLAAGLLLGAAPSRQGAGGSLAGQLLVAAPTIGDPRFSHTVILLLRQDDTGAFGIVLNRPIEERTIASLLDAVGDHEKGVKCSPAARCSRSWALSCTVPTIIATTP